MLVFRKTWIALGCAFIGTVIFLSLNKHPVDWGYFFGVKIGHALAYCWLMFWFAQIFKSLQARIAIAVALCIMGVLLEFAQLTTSYRTFGYKDMRDNAIGVVGGLLLGLTWLSTMLESVDGALARMKQAR